MRFYVCIRGRNKKTVTYTSFGFIISLTTCNKLDGIIRLVTRLF
jgi:hypothetical protein